MYLLTTLTFEFDLDVSVVVVTHNVQCAAGQGGEPPEALRDRRQPRPEGLAGQAAQLHGGARHPDLPVPHHFQKPTRSLQAVHVHQGSGRLSRGTKMISHITVHLATRRRQYFNN